MALVRFVLGDATFALPARDVLEATRAAAIARLPGAPAIAEGVLNLRGELLPVLDIRSRAGISPSLLHPDQHFLVTRSGPRTVVLRVDQVLDLIEVAPEAIAPPEPDRAEHARVAGLVRLADGAIAIIDLPRFLSLEEEQALDAALAVRAP